MFEIDISNRRLSTVTDNFKRFLFHELPENEKMVGARIREKIAPVDFWLSLLKTRILSSVYNVLSLARPACQCCTEGRSS